ncbi:hypothetical protein M409DRAFT_56891 [Zasmidium cellare ATCC 36951]|uniref:Uncharacterized protein n=1 Tax=Zasmidium cellare ATCC 36951 TaxID=1080233 RepID=A0A6A6CAK7_ZASCE|nr:uncharacterized protein M409DRAFT_56891 [Zasmidium cellare ATCC 36951]KAF2164194.1 hypothetical protein M409DRAFT_56891 [Zasmidium cellare ATCC 36951]
MAAVGIDLLRVIAYGNLQLKKQQDAKIRAQLQYWRSRPHRQPGIYMLELVHRDTKQSLSVNQLKFVLRKAIDYVELRDHNAAFLIDNAFKRTSAADVLNGARRYMKAPIQSQTFFQFAHHVEQMCAKIPQNRWDEPMAQPMREVGYGQYAIGRIGDHNSHNSSNYLMGLFDAICKAFEQELGGRYTIIGEVIFQCWDEEQCCPAEELFTCIAQADIASGRGFCHSDAGTTAMKAEGDEQFDWDEIRMDALKTSPYLANMRVELKVIQQVKELQDQLPDLEARLEELANIELPDDDDDLDETALQNRLNSQQAEIARNENIMDVLKRGDQLMRRLGI